MNIKLDRLNLPESPKDAPQIDFGADFEDFDDIHKIIYLKKLSSALNHSADLIQKERNKLLDDIKLVNDVCANADKALEIQKAIVLKSITDRNTEKQGYIYRILELESRVKAQDTVINLLNKDK